MLLLLKYCNHGVDLLGGNVKVVTNVRTHFKVSVGTTVCFLTTTKSLVSMYIIPFR